MVALGRDADSLARLQRRHGGWVRILPLTEDAVPPLLQVALEASSPINHVVVMSDPGVSVATDHAAGKHELRAPALHLQTLQACLPYVSRVSGDRSVTVHSVELGSGAPDPAGLIEAHANGLPSEVRVNLVLSGPVADPAPRLLPSLSPEQRPHASRPHQGPLVSAEDLAAVVVALALDLPALRAQTLRVSPSPVPVA